MKYSISTKILAGFMLTSVIPIAVTAFVYLGTFDNYLRKSAFQRLSATADEKAGKIDSYFQERLQDAVVIAGSSQAREALAEISGLYYSQGVNSDAFKKSDSRLRELFRPFVESGEYYDLFLITAKGDIVFSITHESDFGTNLFHGPYKDSGLARVFSSVSRFMQPDISDFRHYEPSDEQAAFIATPVFYGGRTAGAVALQVNIKRVYGVISDYTGLGNTGETVVFSARDDGDINIVSPVRNGSIPGMMPDSEAADACRLALKGGRGAGERTDYREVETLSVWRYLPVVRWGMIVKIDRKEAFYESNQVLFRNIIMLAAVIFAVIMIAWITGSRLSAPIQDLKKLAVRFSGGDFDSRCKVSAKDEIGDLAEVFNRMADSLQEYRDKMQQKVDEQTTELKKSNAQLQQEIEERIRVQDELRLASNIFENTTEAILVTDGNVAIIDANQAYCDMTGYGLKELTGKNPGIVRSGRHDEEFYRKLWYSVNTEGKWSGEIWDRKKNGEIFPSWLNLSRINDTEGNVINYVGIFTDITHLKSTEAKLENLAYYDALTALPNRLLYNDRLENEIKKAKRNNVSFPILFLDLDRFKYVNDTMGHNVGDLLLLMVAERLSMAVRGSDTVARLGGDEFILILADSQNPDSIGMVAEKIIRSIGEPFNMGESDVFIGASIGIAVFPQDGDNIDDLMKNADIAMYHAKEAGRNNFKFYNPEMDKKNQERVELEQRLRKAVAEGEFQLWYQPQFSLEKGKVTGVEALIRWMTSDGMIPPDRFIPVAEESGLIDEIGDWVIGEACRQAEEWHEKGIGLRIAINLSGRQFRNDSLLKTLQENFDRYDFNPSLLEVEITEGTLIEDVTKTGDILKQIHSMNLTIAIDDFGTGYSSLAYLKTFPIDKLKVDRAFIKDLPDDINDTEITSAIVSMAKSLNMKVVAEGVETREQLEFLKGISCDIIQGYYISRPVPAADIETFLLDGKISV